MSENLSDTGSIDALLDLGALEVVVDDRPKVESKTKAKAKAKTKAKTKVKSEAKKVDKIVIKKSVVMAVPVPGHKHLNMSRKFREGEIVVDARVIDLIVANSAVTYEVISD